ncbi:MAG: hypothetical protein ACREQH_15180, partial [Candidatus Binatus sp.]
GAATAASYPAGKVDADSTTSAAMASAPPYSASSGRFVTTGSATVTPLDPGAGKVSTGGGAPSSGTLDAPKGITPSISP